MSKCTWKCWFDKSTSPTKDFCEPSKQLFCYVYWQPTSPHDIQTPIENDITIITAQHKFAFIPKTSYLLNLSTNPSSSFFLHSPWFVPALLKICEMGCFYYIVTNLSFYQFWSNHLHGETFKRFLSWIKQTHSKIWMVLTMVPFVYVVTILRSVDFAWW